MGDQLEALKAESRRFGTTGDDIDFSLLLDGLEDERQQRITIDVAYRYFSTPRRSFIVADSPGHEQYTRNMATGASSADLAVLLVDARKGVLPQTRRHSLICSLFGIRHVVLAVNKLDLVGFDREVFDKIATDYAQFAADLGFASLVTIPLSARHGDNLTERSPRTPWYRGPSLLEHLETIDVDRGRRRPAVPLPGAMGQSPEPRIPRVFGHRRVRRRWRRATRSRSWVRRAPRGSRRSSPSTARCARASAGDAVTLTLEDEIDIARGDMLVPPRCAVPNSPTSSPRISSG